MLSFSAVPADVFWDEVHTKYWEQRPGLMRFEQGQPPLTSDCAFSAVTCGKGPEVEGRFWAERDPDPVTIGDFDGFFRDPAGVFSFVLKGTRTYGFWAAEAFTPDDPALYRPDREIIERHLPDAEVITAGPDDLVKWPSGSWHVVLSDGIPFVTAQVSAYFDLGLDAA